jgi:hypothetical protein
MHAVASIAQTLLTLQCVHVSVECERLLPISSVNVAERSVADIYFRVHTSLRR